MTDQMGLDLDFHDVIRPPLPIDFYQRRGRFTFEESWIKTEPRHLLAVMSQCIVVRAESLWAEDKIEYTALSKYFDPLGLGSEIPMYNWIIDVNNTNEVIRLKAEKVK